ncbi:MAG: hypothetical protein R2774_04180 [Saprospiraceae bacterium]
MNNSSSSISYEQFMDAFLDTLHYNKKTQQKIISEVASILHANEATIYNKMQQRSKFTLEEICRISRAKGISLDQIIQKDNKENAMFSFYADGLRYRPRTYKDYIDNILKHFQIITTFESPKGIFLANEVPLFHFLRFPNLIYFKLYIWNITNWTIPNVSEYYDPSTIVNDPEIQQSVKTLYHLFNTFHSTEIWNPNMLDITLAQLDYLCSSGRIKNTEHKKNLISELRKLTTYLENISNDGYKLSLKDEKKSSIDVYLNELLTNSEMILIDADGIRVLYDQFDSPNYISNMDPKLTHYVNVWMQKIIKKSTHICGTGDKDKKVFFNRLNQSIDALEMKIS